MFDSVQTWLRHIRALSEDIGPRGSTTEGERLGAEYCRQALATLGYEVQVEGFSSARSIFEPHLLAASVMLIAYAVYPLAGRLTAGIAAALSLLALGSDLLELSFRENPLRWLVSKGSSQNVVATVSPTGEQRQDLVLIGHIDTQRTPLIFSSKGWLDSYKAFTTIAFLAFALQTLLYILGALTEWRWVWPVTLVSAVCSLLLILLCLQADSTPFCAGANDNATGAGLVLTLAEQLQTQPLEHTRVWLACTGCEEVQHYGAIDFFRRHRAELHKPVTIAFEMLGCTGPAWLVKEGIVVPFYADRGLVALAERLSGEHPEWQAHATQINGGNTEMADALRIGIPAITLTGMTPEGDAPYWHMLSDTYDKMDEDVLQRAYHFTWAYIQALDELGNGGSIS
jgi:Peptidase family M28